MTNAPWYGGFWERLVFVVKRCLKKTVGKASLKFYELQIVLPEIELILNSRPLNQLCDDDTNDILTPNHLLFGRKLYQINPNFEHSYEEFQINMPKRVKHVENTTEHFWKRWRAEYVTSLREYQKLHKPNTQAVPSKNDLVLVFDDKQPRQKWLLGKITELIPNNGGKIRGAKVFQGKTRNIIDRPVNRLYPVETNFQFALKGDKQGSDQKDEANSRRKRNAAELAKL